MTFRQWHRAEIVRFMENLHDPHMRWKYVDYLNEILYRTFADEHKAEWEKWLDSEIPEEDA